MEKWIFEILCALTFIIFLGFFSDFNFQQVKENYKKSAFLNHLSFCLVYSFAISILYFYDNSYVHTIVFLFILINIKKFLKRETL